ncbi:MAG: phenylalanine--tRNA ligase subunit beta [Pseudomonadota bacterium]|nr:phenylalanine--tRNA ligase subunit beta [Pseudomonadota bacterium]
MKIAHKHLIKNIKNCPSIEEISEKLYQLGHEHEFIDSIFDMEVTPNRGDCLSLRGISRDLKSFYDVEIDNRIYEKNIKNFEISFENNVKDICPAISFLKVEIDEIPDKYNYELQSYFDYLNVKKINFFTDISNYVSYETGQPTHCYNLEKVGDKIKLDFLKDSCKFETLVGKTINLDNKDLVFCNKHNQVINLAGVMGGKDSACEKSTKSAIIECAYFSPETILGKTIKHNINSEAAYKFERNTDPSSHEYVLRRFIKLIEEHTKINNIEIFSEINSRPKSIAIPYNPKKINAILGTSISNEKIKNYLQSLGFLITDESIKVPTHRHDIESLNDIAEEIARIIGYNNIDSKPIKISSNKIKSVTTEEVKIKSILTENGFFEVINDPFVSSKDKNSIQVDNPLDSNKKYLRTNLRNSLINNLLFNERRQKDIIKLFEISDVYSLNTKASKRTLGIIASGRVDKNYRDFSKKINNDYLSTILGKTGISSNKYKCENISREGLDSKSKDSIFYVEIEIDSSIPCHNSPNNNIPCPQHKYNPISEYPSSKRDLSYLIHDHSKYLHLQKYIDNLDEEILKEVFIFDYFLTKNTNEIKIGFRFIFQDIKSTVTESKVNDIMNVIISETTNIKGISIPGLENENE